MIRLERQRPTSLRQATLLLACVSCIALAFDIDPQDLAEAIWKYGEVATQRLQQWVLLLNNQNNNALSEEKKLELVNRFFNKIPYVSDQEHWGAEDYWATPVQLVASNGGDCEDYAIAKYMTLVKLGVPEEKLRITYVKVKGFNQQNMRRLLSGNAPQNATMPISNDEAHMVLTYYQNPDATPLILDNLKDSILSAPQRPELVPVYSFSGDSVWLINKWSDKAALIGGAEKLERWASLQKQLRY